jgi:7-cyano-7-deazaguanine synthase
VPETPALVLFSGGQDSTVCLAWALERYARVETIGFRYGQRHSVELTQRSIIRDKLARLGDTGRRLGPDAVLDLPGLQSISDTALTRETKITFAATGLPTTFVPGRNLLFLTYAAALAYRRGISTLVGGMCETDFSGYPDCRNDTIQTLAQALTLGLATPMTVETPLMYIDKAGTWELAAKLGGEDLVRIVIEDTHTCYMGVRSERHDWGYGCGHCPACELRAKGWTEWQARKS